MSGRFLPVIRFPIYIEECKEARLQIEPILCAEGYGVEIKLILTLTGGSGKKTYEYERTIYSDILTQKNINSESFFYETTFEFFEGLYYNKVSQDVAVPMVAIILKEFVPDLINKCGLDLSEYYFNIGEKKSKHLGYRD